MDDKAKEFSQQQKRRQREQNQARKREGEVYVDYAPQGNQKNKPAKGDYVDYEEIK